MAILAKHHSQLLSSISGLVPGLYLAVGDIKGKGKAVSPDDLSTGLKKLHLDPDTLHEDHRVEFASLRLLYTLVQSESRTTFHNTLLELTVPPSQRLYPKSGDTSIVTYRLSGLLRRDQLRFALEASRALSIDTFNPLDYFALLRNPRASPYERIVLGWAREKVKERAWEVMRKAYLSTEVGWAQRLCGLEGGEEDWLTRKEARIEGTLVKLR